MELEPGFVSLLPAPFEDDDALGQARAKGRFMGHRSTLNVGGCDISFVFG